MIRKKSFLRFINLVIDLYVSISYNLAIDDYARGIARPTLKAILKTFKTEGQNSYTASFFPKKKSGGGSYFIGESVPSFPKIILGKFCSVREACESRPCAIEPARRLERPKEEMSLELEFIQSFIKQDGCAL